MLKYLRSIINELIILILKIKVSLLKTAKFHKPCNQPTSNGIMKRVYNTEEYFGNKIDIRIFSPSFDRLVLDLPSESH